MSMRWSEEDLNRHLARGAGESTMAVAASSPTSTAAIKLGPQRGRQQGMNKTEAEYAQLLELRLRAGEIHWYGFERIKLRLADNTFYTPDFALLMPDNSLQFHETKGFMRDDANVKIKVAAGWYPFDIYLIRKVKQQWVTKKISSRFQVSRATLPTQAEGSGRVGPSTAKDHCPTGGVR
jgi:hypothetical protein